MGGCNCSKQAAPTGWGSNPRAEQEAQNAAILNGNSTPNGAQQQAAQTGGTQSFALRDSSGTVQQFGSVLERNAYRARYGGVVVS